MDTYAIDDLKNKYFKVKDCLARCGNSVTDVTQKEELINILFSFFNKRIFFNKN